MTLYHGLYMEYVQVGRSVIVLNREDMSLSAVLYRLHILAESYCIATLHWVDSCRRSIDVDVSEEHMVPHAVMADPNIHLR